MLAAILLSALAQPPAAPGAAASRRPVSLRAGEAARFRFDLARRSAVTVETSGGEATELTLSDGPYVLAVDDGAGEGLNARIATTLGPGSYRLSVRSLVPGRPASFVLGFAAAPAPDPGPAPPPPAPIPPPAPAPEPSVLGLLNAARVRLGVPAYAADDRLAAAAQRHADGMASGAVPFGHAGFPGRVYDAGYPRTTYVSEGCFILDPPSGFTAGYWVDFLATHPAEAHGRDFRNPLFARVGVGHARGPAGEFLVLEYGSAPDPAAAPAPAIRAPAAYRYLVAPPCPGGSCPAR